jgi:hypothetical protein
VTSQRTTYFSSTVSADDITGRNNAPIHQRITAKWLKDNPFRMGITAGDVQQSTETWHNFEPDLAIYLHDIKTRAKESIYRGRKWIIEKDGKQKGFESTEALGAYFEVSSESIFFRIRYYHNPEFIELKGFKIWSIS